MKKICKNCANWRFIRENDFRIKDGLAWPGPHGECDVICDLVEWDDKAWTSMSCECERVYEGQESNLMTKPEFGCILWENKNG